MGGRKSFISQGAPASGVAASHTIATSGGMPGSGRSELVWSFTVAFEPSSQTFRQAFLGTSETCSSLSMAAICPVGPTCECCNSEPAVAACEWVCECVWLGASSRHAFAIPDDRANNHTNRAATAVFRLVRLFEKDFMLGTKYDDFILGVSSG